MRGSGSCLPLWKPPSACCDHCKCSASCRRAGARRSTLQPSLLLETVRRGVIVSSRFRRMYSWQTGVRRGLGREPVRIAPQLVRLRLAVHARPSGRAAGDQQGDHDDRSSGSPCHQGSLAAEPRRQRRRDRSDCTSVAIPQPLEHGAWQNVLSLICSVISAVCTQSSPNVTNRAGNRLQGGRISTCEPRHPPSDAQRGVNTSCATALAGVFDGVQRAASARAPAARARAPRRGCPRAAPAARPRANPLFVDIEEEGAQPSAADRRQAMPRATAPSELAAGRPAAAAARAVARR